MGVRDKEKGKIWLKSSLKDIKNVLFKILFDFETLYTISKKVYILWQ